MRKYRVIFQIGSIVVAILSLLFMLYFFAPYDFIESHNIYIEETNTNIPIIPITLRVVIGVIITIFFTILFFKSEKKSHVRICTTLAFVGLLFLLIARIFHLGPDLNFINAPLITRWSAVFWLFGNILVCIAVLRFIKIFPYSSLSFWGGVVFSTFLIIEMVLVFVDFSFDSYYCDNIAPIVWTISSIGISLFFYGLTFNKKQKNGK